MRLWCKIRVQDSGYCLISSGRLVLINTRAQRKILHTWIILVIVDKHLVHIGRIDESTEYVS